MDEDISLLMCELADFLRNPTVRLVVIQAGEVEQLRAECEKLRRERDRAIAQYGQEVQVNLRLSDDLKAAKKLGGM